MPSGGNIKQDNFGTFLAQQTPDTGMKNLVVIFTLLSIFFGIISAVIGYFISDERQWSRQQMTELLNFQITITIIMVIGTILDATVIFAIIGLPLMIIFGFINLIFLIIGTIKASQGLSYKYPLTLRLVS